MMKLCFSHVLILSIAATGTAFVAPPGSPAVSSLYSTKNDDLLSHWLSSPERYAEKLGLTVEQVQQKKIAHQSASQSLQDQISTLSDGNLKHQLICEHRYRNRKHPFVCSKCWCYLPICLCQETSVQSKIELPKTVEQVVLWTHHREWASTSNSGSLLPLLLQDTRLLMKGLSDHENDIQRIFQNSSSTTVVLWPDNDKSKESTRTSNYKRITWQELHKIHKETPVSLLALEGTWRTARRMAAKLPDHVVRLSLPPDVASWNHSDDHRNASSLLKPLRRQEGGNPDNICTAEAVTAALVGLGMSPTDGRRILNLVEKKVDQTRRYRGKPA